jgi:mannose/cellobiose epimerase-like protein (N-acyl-D-glucosamine 2-epimerase family)
MASNLIHDAIAVGTLGIAAEKAQELADAKNKYTEAARLFLAAVRAEAHPQRAQLLKAQAFDFLERAEGAAARLRDASDPLLGEARKLEAAAEVQHAVLG